MRAVLGLAFVAALAVARGALAADDPSLGQVERKVVGTLGESRAVQGLVFHWNAAETPAELVDAAVPRNLGFYADVEKRLGLRPPGVIHVFLYRDSARMRELTGRHEGSVAYSSGNAIHEPIDYGDCHEYVHVFATHLATDAESVPPETFFVEGLATALQARDEGISVSDWAACAVKAGRAPPLVELRRTFPEGTPAGVHPYHLAGSFMEFLIERFGMAEVKRVYTHCLEFQSVLGRSFAALEMEWRASLLARAVPDAAADRALERLGFRADVHLPKALRDAKTSPLFDGTTLDGWTAGAPGVWSVRDGRIAGVNPSKWARLTRAVPPGAQGVRVRFRVVSGRAFQVRLGEGDASSDAIFAAWRSFLTAGRVGGYDVVASAEWRFRTGETNELVFAVGDGVGRVHVNGLLALTSSRRLAVTPSSVGLGVEEGSVEVLSVDALLAAD